MLWARMARVRHVVSEARSEGRPRPWYWTTAARRNLSARARLPGRTPALRMWRRRAYAQKALEVEGRRLPAQSRQDPEDRRRPAIVTSQSRENLPALWILRVRRDAAAERKAELLRTALPESSFRRQQPDVSVIQSQSDLRSAVPTRDNPSGIFFCPTYRVQLRAPEGAQRPTSPSAATPC